MSVNKEFKKQVDAVKFKRQINQNEIAGLLGVSKTYLSDVINGRSPLNDKFLSKFSELFSDCFIKEQTYYGGEVDQSNVNGDNIQGNHVTVNKYVEELMERLKSRDEALMKAQEQVSKAQEQMDRLLAIIDNLTRQH